MKAVVFHKPKDVSVDNVPDPQIIHPTDAIIRVTSTAICGSDLHIYNGMIPQPKDMIIGHEFMGIVEDVGANVTNIKKGDRVIVPFPVACGGCYFCSTGLPTHCENSNDNYGPEGNLMTEKGAGLFGYTDLYGGYDGGQAEFVRVPYADFGPRKISDALTDDEALFLTDIFPTGYAACEWGNVKPGDSVAIFGCGPVGLMAMKVAWLRGAERVIALDIEDYRLTMAASVCSAEIINIKDNDKWLDEIRQMTHGRGVDVAIDAVGMEADRTFLDRIASVIRFEKGTINALRMCISAVRRGGIVSVVGVYGYPYDNFPWHQIFDKGLTIRCGQAPVQQFIDDLIKMVEEGRIKLDDIITHKLPLEQAAHAYDIFNNKKDNCVKVILKP